MDLTNDQWQRIVEYLPKPKSLPGQSGRRKPVTQNGRLLRRYRRRWKVERLFARLQNFRRLVVRYEYHLINFLAMAQLGSIKILLRRVLG